MKILIVAGHGAGDVGAVGNGHKEADLTRELAKLIQSKLSRYATVDVADISKNWYRYICKQGNYFNFKPYDYVLELHFNAIKKETALDGKTKGTEIYITTSEQSGSVELEILKGIKSIGFANRGLKRNNFALIRYIKKQGVSAALLETCFIDDIDDMRLYTAKKEKIAEAIAEGIAKGFGLTKKTTTKTEAKGAEDMTKADVIAIIKEYEAEKAKEAAGSWSKGSFNKATAKGVLDGSSPKSSVTREMFAVVLDRLGLLDK